MIDSQKQKAESPGSTYYRGSGLVGLLNLSIFVVTGFFLLFSPVQVAADQAESKPVIGIIYRNTDTGERYRDGILKALEALPDIRAKVVVEELAYADEKLGTRLMIDVLKRESNKVHILFGPTESDVFVRALERRSELEKFEIPVISSLVTADVPHVRSGWFFLTNVDVKRRAQAAYDYLNKYWINSIAVLYANTEFGRRGERAFQAELNDAQASSYLALPYSLPAASARVQVRQLLERRPEAIGIFGEREDLREVYSALKQMNSDATPYQPILFTMIDARSLISKLDDLYFVSVTGAAGESPHTAEHYDDVKGLAYDTTIIVLKELEILFKKKDFDLRTGAGRRHFRDRFEAILRGTPLVTDSVTGITFSNFKNVAKTRVLYSVDNKLLEFDLNETVGVKEKIKKKASLLVSRYGIWPWFNATLLVLIATFMSVVDIKKWYTGNTWRLIIESHFYLLLALNSILILSLYVYMGETGAISYDSIMAALVIAFAPLALLRTNFFETASGKSVGLAKLYDGFLQWINDRLMIARHSRTSIYVNLIAFHNTVDGMRSYLRDIYREQPSAERKIKLQTELSELVNDSIPYLERRKVCARLLLRTKKWNELQLDAMAPQGELPQKRPSRFWRLAHYPGGRNLDGDEINATAGETHTLRDPEVVIKEAARFCVNNLEGAKALEAAIDNALDRIGDTTRRQSLENALRQDLLSVMGEQARLRRKIAFLFVLRGYDEKFLRNLLAMPADNTRGQ